MKKIILLLAAILFVAVSCKKVEKAPIGPTDIRIRNITTLPMTNVTVNTYDSTYNFGTINAGAVSDYHRFDRAYPKAYITAVISGQKYKTDTIPSYAYMQYLSQIKATYEIWIEGNKLSIYRAIPESDLK